MRGLTPARAVWVSSAVAGLVFVSSLANGWAGDDLAVVRDNPAAHSLAAALGNWFAPYWPPPFVAAGLYRPLAVLSYGFDWMLGGGEPWVFHLTNVVLHAGTTALIVLLALAWLPPAGALAAGLVFAVHPVHVEAVSNVVGRAEILAAAALLGAVLLARHYRHAPDDVRARLSLAGCLACVSAALFAKEHAVVAVAVLALDHVLDMQSKSGRPMAPLHAAAFAITAAWLFLWQGIAGGFVGTGATAVFYNLTGLERTAMMLPVQLDVVRLLVWPMELSSDYNPQVVPFRRTFTAIALLGLATATAVVGLGVASFRSVPAVSFGILTAVASYAPTSNLLFPSGVVLAERALYLPVICPALVAGWLFTQAEQRSRGRPAAAALAVVVLLFGARSLVRTPFWRDPISPVIEEAADHPESYRARLLLGDLLARAGDSTRALSEYLAAGALFERDPFVPVFAARMAEGIGRPEIALAESERGYRVAPAEAVVVRSLVQAQLASGLRAEALQTAIRAAREDPTNVTAAETVVGALRGADAEPWRRLLAEARLAWLVGRPVDAIGRLDSLSAVSAAPLVTEAQCAEIDLAASTTRILTPSLQPVSRRLLEMLRASCAFEPASLGAAGSGAP